VGDNNHNDDKKKEGENKDGKDGKDGMMPPKKVLRMLQKAGQPDMGMNKTMTM